MATTACYQTPGPKRGQSKHQHCDSTTGSEDSFFEFETSTCETTNSWNNYFESWDHTETPYNPLVLGTPDEFYASQLAALSQLEAEDRDQHQGRKNEADFDGYINLQRNGYRNRKSDPGLKRFGVLYEPRRRSEPPADEMPGAHLNNLLDNASSNTDELLQAMWNPEWTGDRLRKWYENSNQTTSDLALYKIMYSLRYTSEGKDDFDANRNVSTGR